MTRALLAFVGAVTGLLGIPLLALGGAAGASGTALTEIPPTYLALYQEAAMVRCPGLPWSVLAAIGSIESGHGRTGGAELRPDGTVVPRIIGPVLDGSAGVARIIDTDRGQLDDDPDFDRAVGPMQFIPRTWASYGVDASGDGFADPHNAIDAIHTAAAYLCTNGGDDPDRLVDAILAYNRSTEYVQRVLSLGSRYAANPGSIVAVSDTLVAMVLANPRLVIYEEGRGDIAAGRIDARVLRMLQVASEWWTLTVSSLRTGHSRCVGGGDYPGCTVSNHWYGRGVDISHVEGRVVTVGNPEAYEFVTWLLSSEDENRPDEVGHPWRALTEQAGSFSDSAHLTHVHVAWDRGNG